MAKKMKKDVEKLGCLKASGTLYPNAQKVKDECFVGNDFFDANDLVQVKYEMLRRVAKEDWTVSKAVDAFGFSRPSYYETHAGFVSEGMQGLLPKRRGPKEPHKLSEEILEFISGIVESEESFGSADLAERILKQFEVSVHPRSIGRALALRDKKKDRQDDL